MQHDTIYVLLMTLMLSLLIIVTRVLPFMISRLIKNSTTIRTLGRSLPAYIMVLLVIFEINIAEFNHFPYGIPAIIALIVVTGVHCWRRNIMLSIIAGTLTYILLMQLII